MDIKRHMMVRVVVGMLTLVAFSSSSTSIPPGTFACKSECKTYNTNTIKFDNTTCDPSAAGPIWGNLHNHHERWHWGVTSYSNCTEPPYGSPSGPPYCERLNDVMVPCEVWVCSNSRGDCPCYRVSEITDMPIAACRTASHC